jgi:hypothetical protein
MNFAAYLYNRVLKNGFFIIDQSAAEIDLSVHWMMISQPGRSVLCICHKIAAGLGT